MGLCPRLVPFLILVHFIIGILIHSLAESADVVGEGKHKVLLKDIGLNVFDKGVRDIPTHVCILIE